MRSKSRSGFTLIELLIVVAIIGLLVTVLVAALLGAFSKGKEAEAKNFMETIVPQAISVWQDEKGKDKRCPPSGNELNDFTLGNSLLWEELVGKPREAGRTSYINMTGVEELKDKGRTYILDPWGTPYIYRDWSAPPPKGGKTDHGQGNIKPFNPGSFDMISAGQDKTFGTADDIVRGGHQPITDEGDLVTGKKKK